MLRSDPAFYENALRRIKLIILVLGLGRRGVSGNPEGCPLRRRISDRHRCLLSELLAGGRSWWRLSAGRKCDGHHGCWRCAWPCCSRAATFIIMLTGFNAGAAVMALLLPGAAVTIEILYELIHGT